MDDSMQEEFHPAFALLDPIQFARSVLEAVAHIRTNIVSYSWSEMIGNVLKSTA